MLHEVGLDCLNNAQLIEFGSQIVINVNAWIVGAADRTFIGESVDKVKKLKPMSFHDFCLRLL